MFEFLRLIVFITLLYILSLVISRYVYEKSFPLFQYSAAIGGGGLEGWDLLVWKLKRLGYILRLFFVFLTLGTIIYFFSGNVILMLLGFAASATTFFNDERVYWFVSGGYDRDLSQKITYARNYIWKYFKGTCPPYKIKIKKDKTGLVAYLHIDKKCKYNVDETKRIVFEAFNFIEMNIVNVIIVPEKY